MQVEGNISKWSFVSKSKEFKFLKLTIKLGFISPIFILNNFLSPLLSWCISPEGIANELNGEPHSKFIEKFEESFWVDLSGVYPQPQFNSFVVFSCFTYTTSSKTKTILS